LLGGVEARGRCGAEAAWSGTEIGAEGPRVELVVGRSKDVLLATAGGVVGSDDATARALKGAGAWTGCEDR